MRFGFSAKKRAVLRAPSGPTSQRSECSLGATSSIIPSPMATTAKVSIALRAHGLCTVASLLLKLAERDVERPLISAPDDVITALGDSEIGDYGDLLGALRGYQPGDTVGLTVFRDGAERTLEVTLGERQE